MSDVKGLRLSTGEDVIAKVDSGSEYHTLEKPFVIIPQQMGPGKPVQLMRSLYNAFGKGDKVEVAKDKVVFMTDPKLVNLSHDKILALGREDCLRRGLEGQFWLTGH